MQTITIQADPAMGDEWLVHTIVAMPVMPNNGYIIDDNGAFSTHVNRRDHDTWTVPFRNPGVVGYPKMRHYGNPLAVVRAIIDKEHNDG